MQTLCYDKFLPSKWKYVYISTHKFKRLVLALKKFQMKKKKLKKRYLICSKYEKIILN